MSQLTNSSLIKVQASTINSHNAASNSSAFNFANSAVKSIPHRNSSPRCSNASAHSIFMMRSPFLKYDSVDEYSSTSSLSSLNFHHHYHSILFGHQDELIVTPFAQILASLKNVRQNFIYLSSLPHEKYKKQNLFIQAKSFNLTLLNNNSNNQPVSALSGDHLTTTTTTTTATTTASLNFGPFFKKENIESFNIKDEASRTKFSLEILEELDWCLSQLEHMQSHKTISDIASTKFKRMLNKELSHFAEQNKSDNQIAEYICNTYLDQNEDIDLPAAKIENHDSFNYKLAAAKSFSNSNLKEEDTNSKNTSSNTLNNNNSENLCNKNVGRSSFDKIENIYKKQHKLSEPNALAASDESSACTKTQPIKITTNTSINLSCSSPLNQSYLTLSSSNTNNTKMNRIFSAKNAHISNNINNNNNSNNSKNQIAQSVSENDAISVDDLPKYGIEANKDEENDLENLMENLDVWGVNVFLIDELTNHRPLTAVVYTIFKKRELIETFSINPVHLINYLTMLEEHYQSVPYHNKIHAADVTQSIHVLLSSRALESVFSDLEILAAVLSAAIHDVDHPGLTNQYLINTGSELALMYNDESVLENHHLAVAFKLLQHPTRDILANLTKKQRQIVRKMIIDMVLATDMSKHMSLLAELKTMVETKKVAGSGIIELENYQDRIRVLQNMLHCADLSNPTKPLDIYQQWIDRVMDEFFLQGDREASEGLEISAMCDRHNANVEKSQIGFMDFIVHPLWESWADLVAPDAQSILDTLENNRNWYYERVEKSNSSCSSNVMATTTCFE